MGQKVQFLLEDIRNKEIVLPEFQREYTWNRDQAKQLLDSIIKEYPTGSLLIWVTSDPPALKSFENSNVNKRVQVLLDGQQRLTALYLLILGEIPPFYKEITSSNDPRNLYYNLKTKELKYYMKIEMENNPLWVNVVDCFKDKVNPKEITEKIAGENEKYDMYTTINDNIKSLLKLKDYEYPVMRVKEESELKDALTVFDRVNTGGTPLSEADVALAYMCSNWEEIRREFKKEISKLKNQGFEFDLKFMIRSLNAVINCRAYYHLMHNLGKKDLINGWDKLKRILDYVINFLKNRAYIYSKDDMKTHNVLIPLIGYLSQNNLKFKKEKNLKLMIYWLYACLFKRHYSVSVDQALEKDLLALKSDKPIEKLIGILEEEGGGLRVDYEDLLGRGVGHPFYDMTCFVIRKNSGVDWANNLDLSNPIGKSYEIQRHHIFPRSVLEKAGYDTANNQEDYNKVHEIANRVPLTRSSNMEIFDTKPSEYLPKVEKNNLDNLSKFFIPLDEELWKVENFKSFLDERRKLLVKGINKFMDDLIK